MSKKRDHKTRAKVMLRYLRISVSPCGLSKFWHRRNGGNLSFLIRLFHLLPNQFWEERHQKQRKGKMREMEILLLQGLI